jgi:hypothetical protein
LDVINAFIVAYLNSFWFHVIFAWQVRTTFLTCFYFIKKWFFYWLYIISIL